MPRRLIQLIAGLVTFAFGESLIIQARLGVMSWDVLHQGLTYHLGLTIGQWSIIVGALVLLLKAIVIATAVIWVKWTFPRFRQDQLMAFAWKVLTPLALLQLLVAGLVAIWL